VLACDLPLMTTELLQWLAEVPTESTVIPLVDGRAQPLCARWSAADLYRLVELFDYGYRTFKTMYDKLDIAWVDDRGWGVAASARTFSDADAPEDLERLGIIWEGGGAKSASAGRSVGRG
jgi:molybdopterin-guanine dinucleotide biosynthesis protein A